MAKFYSIGGTSHVGDRNREAPRHPGAEEFYRSRSDTSHSTTGLVGEKFLYHGDPAEGLHEERNHDGTVDLYFRRSALHDSGTMRMRWHPGNHAREMASGDVRRVFD